MAKKTKKKGFKKIFSYPPYYLLLGVVVLLLLFGTVMILSASSIIAYNRTGDSFYYLKRHLVAVLIGLSVMIVFSRLDYRKLRKFSLLPLVVALLLLLMVLVPGVGKVAGGSSRWLPFGFLNLQPSELAKLAIVFWAADILARKRKEIFDLKELLVPLAPVVAAFCLLVIAQPDLGTAIVICVTVFAMMFLAGARTRHIVGIGAVGLASAVFFVFSEEYRRQRLLAFLDPTADPQGKGFHIIQSLLAFGSGGLRGVGLGLSRQKFFYLPAAHTDFILAIIGEELGLVGTLGLVLLFTCLVYLGIRISLKSHDQFGRMLGAGITCMILTQALINMAAVTGLIPITGIPLPLISYGSSSLVFTLSGVGILLNISAQTRRLTGVRGESSSLRRGNSRSHLSSDRSVERAQS